MRKQEEARDSLRLATSLYLGGDIAGATQELSHAEQLATADGDVGSVVLILILVQKAQYLREMGRVDEGRALLAQAESKLADVPAEERMAALASLRLEQGIVERGSGNAALAEQLLREAETEARKYYWGIAILSDILANLAPLYIDTGKLKQAQEILNEAVQIDRKTGKARELSNDLNMLGNLYSAMGDQNTAWQYHTEALGVALDGGFMKEAADASSNMGQDMEDKGDLEGAETVFHNALDIYEDMGNKREAANVRNSLGIIADRKGKLAEAKQLYEQSHQEHLTTEQPENVVRDLINLTTLAMQASQFENAYSYALKAVEQAEKLGLLEILWAVHFNLAGVLPSYLRATIQDKQELAVRLNDEVLPRYAKAIDAIELLRAGIGRPEEREYVLGGKEQVYEEAIFLAGTLRQPKEAFVFSERARARAFLDVMGGERIEHTAAQHPLAQRRQELTRQLLEIEGSDPEKAQAIFQELHLLRSQIVADAPAIAAVTEAQMPSLEKIAAAIPEKTALIEFYIVPNHALFIFVVTSQGLVDCIMVPLEPIDLPGKIAQFRAELEYGVKGVPTGGELFSILFDPIFERIWPMSRLLIVPHRELHSIPFSALWFRLQNREGQFYLCQRFGHSILPSAAFLPLCLTLPRAPLQPGQSRVLGNPTMDLPLAAEEAKQVASLLGTSPLLGPEATRAAFLDAPRDLSVIHAASHGEQNKIDPLLSRILLADGSVTVEDIMESHLTTSLLTLSGCVTGMAERRSGDELIGLTRAAFLAGVPSVITALWNIWDDTSSAFFDYFYSCLVKGMQKDEALWQTQFAFLATGEYAHPMYWAPFILLGDWRQSRI